MGLDIQSLFQGNMQGLGVGAGGLPVGVSSLTGSMAAQEQNAGMQNNAINQTGANIDNQTAQNALDNALLNNPNIAAKRANDLLTTQQQGDNQAQFGAETLASNSKEAINKANMAIYYTDKEKEANAYIQAGAMAQSAGEDAMRDPDSQVHKDIARALSVGGVKNLPETFDTDYLKQHAFVAQQTLPALQAQTLAAQKQASEQAKDIRDNNTKTNIANIEAEWHKYQSDALFGNATGANLAGLEREAMQPGGLAAMPSVRLNQYIQGTWAEMQPKIANNPIVKMTNLELQTGVDQNTGKPLTDDQMAQKRAIIATEVGTQYAAAVTIQQKRAAGILPEPPYTVQTRTPIQLTPGGPPGAVAPPPAPSAATGASNALSEPSKSANGSAPVVANKETYDALPKGAEYSMPNDPPGTVRKKL